MIGATDGGEDPDTFGARATRSVIESEPEALILVNPNRDELFGRPCVPTLADAPFVPDLAIVAVPDRLVPAAVADAASQGVRSAIVISSIGDDGRAQLQDICRKSALRIIGPDCIGFVAVDCGLYATASTLRPVTSSVCQRTGRVAIVSQSGGWSMTLWSMVAARGIDVAYTFSTGMELDLAAEDYVAFLLDQDDIACILMFAEEIRFPSELRWLSTAAAKRRRTIVIVKVGRGSVAADIALSHTGAVVGDWSAFRAAMTADGAVIADSPRQACDIVDLVTSRNFRPPISTQIVVLSNSGGSASLAADIVEAEGLELAPLPDRAHDQLSATLRGRSLATLNPMDTAWAGGTTRILDRYLEMCRDHLPGGILFLGTFIGAAYTEQIIETLSTFASSGWSQPMAIVWPSLDVPARARLGAAGIPVFDDPFDLLRAYGALARAGGVRSPDHPQSLGADLSPTAAAPRTQLGYDEAVAVVSRAGVARPGSLLLDGAVAAAGSLDGLSFPVMVKAATQDVAHKAAVGAMVGPVDDAAGVAEALRTLESRSFGSRAVVEEMVGPGLDLVVSVRRTPFGLIATLGFGGPFAAAFPAELVVAEPWVTEELSARIEQTSVALVADAQQRHGPGGAWVSSDLAALLVTTIDGLAGAIRNDHFEEIELNPLRLIGTDLVALDAKVWVAAA